VNVASVLPDELGKIVVHDRYRAEHGKMKLFLSAAVSAAIHERELRPAALAL
jgi:hypothetical protein